MHGLKFSRYLNDITKSIGENDTLWGYLPIMTRISELYMMWLFSDI